MKPFTPENWRPENIYLVYNGWKKDKKQIGIVKITNLLEHNLTYDLIEPEHAMQTYYDTEIITVESISVNRNTTDVDARINEFEFFELSIEELANFI